MNPINTGQISTTQSSRNSHNLGCRLLKEVLEVDEKGTEAAAATVVEVLWGSSPDMSEPIVMEVNSPFLLAILDLKNQTTLFLGGVTKPEPLN